MQSELVESKSEAPRPEAMVEINLKTDDETFKRTGLRWAEKMRVTAGVADELISGGHCRPTMVKPQPPHRELVDVKLATDGVVIDGVAKRAGQVVKVDAAERDLLIARGHVKPMPVLRMLVANRTVGSRVPAVGELVQCLSVEQAREFHSAGLAEWVNADEVGQPLPQRRAVGLGANGFGFLDRQPTEDVTCGWGASYKRGGVYSIAQDQARALVARGQAIPVGWTPEPEIAEQQKRSREKKPPKHEQAS